MGVWVWVAVAVGGYVCVCRMAEANHSHHQWPAEHFSIIVHCKTCRVEHLPSDIFYLVSRKHAKNTCLKSSASTACCFSRPWWDCHLTHQLPLPPFRAENGYYCATADARGSVAVWDLRKLKSVKTFAAADCGGGSGGATSVDFDLSGSYLAVGTGAGAVRVFGTKEWNAVATLEAGAGANAAGSVAGVKFGAHASFVVAASAQLRVWGTDAMQP